MEEWCFFPGSAYKNAGTKSAAGVCVLVCKLHRNAKAVETKQVKASPEIAGQPLGLTGFSGAATLYSHLHYQLMDGQNFLTAESLPATFTDVTLLQGKRKVHYDDVSLDTGDIILN